MIIIDSYKVDETQHEYVMDSNADIGIDHLTVVPRNIMETEGDEESEQEDEPQD